MVSKKTIENKRESLRNILETFITLFINKLSKEWLQYGLYSSSNESNQLIIKATWQFYTL